MPIIRIFNLMPEIAYVSVKVDKSNVSKYFGKVQKLKIYYFELKISKSSESPLECISYESSK